MRYIHRELEGPLRQAAKSFPAMVLTGPRRAGKTWLLRHLFPKAAYFLLEDPTVVARLRADPHGFLDAVDTPAILDEVQHVPEVFALVRTRIDANSVCPLRVRSCWPVCVSHTFAVLSAAPLARRLPSGL